MKSEKFEELMNKFYAGTANAEELMLLKNEGFIDEQDELYTSIIKEEGKQQMDWSFEDFMQEIPQAKVVAFSDRNNWKKSAMALAAVVLALITLYVLLPQSKQERVNETVSVQVPNKISDSDSKPFAEIILPSAETKDSTAGLQKLMANTQKIKFFNEKKTKQIIDKNLPKTVDNENVRSENKFDEYLVMVNGKPIYNEEDALSITRESLSLVSRNLATTIDEMKPIGQIKIKF